MSWDISQFQDVIGIAAGDFRPEFDRQDPSGLWERAAVDRREDVVAAVASRIHAGADLVVAFTDRLNRVALSGSIDAESADIEAMIEWNQAIVSCFREAASGSERPPLVFCAIGPVEGLWMLEELSASDLHAAYSEQVRRCIDAGADGFLCRSFSELEPMRIAVRAIREAGDLPIIGSMTFDAGADAMDTATGTSIPEACRMLQEEGADMIGVDRGEFPDGTAAIVSLMAESGTLPVYAEVNAGRAEIVDQRVVFREPPAAYGERLERLRDAGVRIVGGGLGAGSDHIVQLCRQRERLVRKGRRARLDD